MNWYYADGQNRLGPLSEEAWDEVVASGKIQPSTLVWNETLPTWTPFSQLPVAAPEPPATLAPTAPVGGGFSQPQYGNQPLSSQSWDTPEPKEETPEAYVERLISEDYQTSASSCLERAWNLFKADFGLLLGSTVLCVLLLIAASLFPFLGFFFRLILSGVLLGGLYSIYLLRLRDEPANIKDLFSGFSGPQFKRLALTCVTNIIASAVLFIPIIITAGVIGITPDNFKVVAAEDPLSVLVIAVVALAASIPWVYLLMGWIFVVPLVADKNLGVGAAMHLSLKKVMQRPWTVAWVIIVGGVVGLSGALAFGFGIIFTIPLYHATLMVLYTDIFDSPVD